MVGTEFAAPSAIKFGSVELDGEASGEASCQVDVAQREGLDWHGNHLANGVIADEI